MAGIVATVALLRGERGGFDTLNGRWLRPDGGYVLDIRVDTTGKIDAIYLNPKPINIANQNGVIMHLRSVSQGAKLQLGPSGLTIKLKK